MGCLACGDQKTVRSHIIPKAFAHDVRDGAKHLIAGSLHHIGGKPSQAGMFSDDLLCASHESDTSAADTYAIDFVRKISNNWKNRGETSALNIDNPDPPMLRKFALTTIWREVHSCRDGQLSLGPYEQAVFQFLFGGGVAPAWPVIVQRTNFTTKPGMAMDFNLHPFRVKFADRSGWAFTVAGVAFFTISDSRGLPDKFSAGRSDINDIALVTVSDPQPITEVGILKSILSNMVSRF